jgi:hypothetical protein
MRKLLVCTLHHLSSNRIVKGEIGRKCSQYGTNLKNKENVVCKIELKRNPESLVDIVTLYNLNDRGSEVRSLKGRRSF